MNDKFVVDVKKIFKDDNLGYIEHNIKNGQIGLDELEKAGITGVVSLMRINDNEVAVDFNLNVMVNLECVRCLSSCLKTMKLKFSQIYSYNPIADEIAYIIINNSIDISRIIKEEILLNLPLKFLCKNSCKGISIK